MSRKNSHRQQEARDRRPLVLILAALSLLLLSAARGLSLFSAGPDPAAGRVVWLEGDLAAGLYLLPHQAAPGDLHRLAGLRPPAPGGPEQPQQQKSVRLLSGTPPQPAAMPARQAPLFFQPMDLNQADGETLTTIPGIGPVLAERIVALRRERGRFASCDDLLAVKGIGPAKIKKLRDFVEVVD